MTWIPELGRRITLCGSTRFKKAWMEWNARLTLEGCIVYSVAMWSHNVRVEPTEKQKLILDQVHLAKIDNSDEVFVLDVGGYIGESTKREIAHAEATGKRVRYLSKEFPLWTEDDCTLTQAQEPDAPSGVERIATEMTSGGDVDQAAVSQVMSELPKAGPCNSCSVREPMGYCRYHEDGFPGEGGACPHRCVTEGGMPPMPGPVYLVDGVYYKPMSDPFKCSICGATEPCKHVIVGVERPRELCGPCIHLRNGDGTPKCQEWPHGEKCEEIREVFSMPVMPECSTCGGSGLVGFPRHNGLNGPVGGAPCPDCQAAEPEINLPPAPSSDEVDRLLEEGQEAARQEHERVEPMRSRAKLRMPIQVGHRIEFESLPSGGGGGKMTRCCACGHEFECDPDKGINCRVTAEYEAYPRCPACGVGV